MGCGGGGGATRSELGFVCGNWAWEGVAAAAPTAEAEAFLPLGSLLGRGSLAVDAGAGVLVVTGGFLSNGGGTPLVVGGEDDRAAILIPVLLVGFS